MQRSGLGILVNILYIGNTTEVPMMYQVHYTSAFSQAFNVSWCKEAR